MDCGLKKCGTSNPVILIDEVDKIVSDFKGDPSAVLLDILDPIQNKNFIDNYIEEPFDLSKVLFILTANDVKNIPTALRDRLEIIEINSYTELEKIDIAKKYILPEIFEEYNINKIKISDELLLSIINGYTKESGVRELNRVLRKIFRNVVINNIDVKSLTQEIIINILGQKKYDNSYIRKNHYGSVYTCGVTPYGGVIIAIESLLVPGYGNLYLTGNVQKSIEESAKVALNYIMGHAKEYKIDVKDIRNKDIHINALNYSIKKDGTSGGVAYTTSLLSLFLEKTIPNDVAFTGEVTLHGDICKVGGIKEKIIGAYNNGFKIVYIPMENKNDLDNVPIDIKDKITIKCVSDYKEVYNDLFKEHKK